LLLHAGERVFTFFRSQIFQKLDFWHLKNNMQTVVAISLFVSHKNKISRFTSR